MNLGALDETSKAPTKQYYPRNISQENRKDTKKEEEDDDELNEGHVEISSTENYLGRWGLTRLSDITLFNLQCARKASRRANSLQ